MNGEVAWHLELDLKSGTLDDFRALMEEMVAVTRDEPGTLSYAWFVSGDGKQIHIYERYVDSAAVLAHMAAFGERFAARFFAAVKLTRASIFGTPSDAVRGILDPFGPSYYAPFGGFVR